MTENNDDEFSLFRAEFAGIKKLQQDTIKLPPKNMKKKAVIKETREQNIEHSHFSDSFEPVLPEEGPMRYCRSDAQKYLMKQLRRGDFSPEIILDLHGLKQQEAKSELAALINCCKKEGLYCCNIIHGMGKHILKKQIPLWLAQHPDILAFHQAPLEFGGQGALLVLVELEDWQMKQDKKR